MSYQGVRLRDGLARAILLDDVDVRDAALSDVALIGVVIDHIRASSLPLRLRR